MKVAKKDDKCIGLFKYKDGRCGILRAGAREYAPGKPNDQIAAVFTKKVDENAGASDDGSFSYAQVAFTYVPPPSLCNLNSLAWQLKEMQAEMEQLMHNMMDIFEKAF